MQTFARGQKMKLADLTPAQQLQIGLSAQAPGLTFDISCFGVDATDKLSDDRYFIFYNQKLAPDGSIQLLDGQSGDNATFAVDLSRLAGTIRKLVFVMTIDGNGTLSQLARGHFRLSANGSEMARFEFSGSDFGTEKAIIVAEIYLKDIWRVAAVGQGFAGGLSAVLKHFGGEEVQSAPPPTPAPAPPRPAPPVNVPPSMPARPAPPAAKPVNLGKVTLDKKGDKQTVDLRKGGGTQPIHINLNWDNPNAGKKGLFGLGGGASPDLDLGCMFRLRDGGAGVIQPLGGNFGARDRAPFIFLDKDDRSGAAQDGENLYIYRPDLIDLVMVFALIYQGAADFAQVNGRMTIRDQSGGEILVRLSNPDRGRPFCAICTIANTGSSIEITKQELYVPGHREADQHFGFGFRWAAGQK
jgi:tellurite resistance protein TerA